MVDILLLLLLQIFLIALNAIFACAEIAVLQMNETKLEHMAAEGNGKAKRLFKLTREPAKFLATIQVAITLSGFLGSAFAADNFSEPIVNWISRTFGIASSATLDSAVVILITLVLSYFTLIFGELVPKRLAMKKAEPIAMGISGLISGISWLFKPVVWFLSVSTNLVLRLCGVDPNEADEEVGEEDIKLMVDAGSENGTIDVQERELIQNVFEFNDTTVGEIATHRANVVFLWAEDDIDVWARTINESRYTCYPICDGSTDNIIGVLNAKEYFRLPVRTRETIEAEAIIPAYFVPETTTANVLFRNMRANRAAMAVIVDEYGGTVGVITMNDLISEIVGDFDDITDDDTDTPPELIEKLGEGEWKLNGNVKLELIEEATGLKLASDDHETITGLVFASLDTIPEDGEQDMDIELDGLTVHIARIENHCIDSALLTVKQTEEQSEAVAE